ncbi:hypothetical protein [Paenibacillus chitinolyticus]|nr:hypothetical protein [Paenibacillus chitinolyticus]
MKEKREKALFLSQKKIASRRYAEYNMQYITTKICSCIAQTT